MIIERHSPLLRALIDRFIIKNPTRNTFQRVWIRQSASALPTAQMPLLLYANHTAWWDGYMVNLVVHDHLRRPARQSLLMVEAATLRKYGFLRYLGAFGVDRDNPRDGIAAIQHAVACLSAQPAGLVAIFPQGKFYHPDARPLQFYNGAGLIAKQAVAAAGTCALLPMALRYEFGREQKPEVFIRLGPPTLITPNHPLHGNAKAITAHMAQALEAEMDALRDDCVASRFEAFVPLLAGNLGVQAWWDGVRGQ